LSLIAAASAPAFVESILISCTFLLLTGLAWVFLVAMLAS
jgi:hypothetical protein